MRLERRTYVSTKLVIVAPILAILASLSLSGILIILAGVNPVIAYFEIVKGAFGSKLAITETLTRASPLILTGLAAAVAFRARLWNIGGEGQFYIGALVAAAVGNNLLLGLPVVISMTLIMLSAMIAGAVLLAGPALLRLRFGIDEVVTTLLLNFIIILFVGLMIEGPLKDPFAFGWPQSVPVDRSLRFADLVPSSRLHNGLLISIFAAFSIWIVVTRTVFGLKARATGFTPQAAAFSGISLSKTIMGVALISGSLAGLAGAIEVMGVTGYVTTTLSPGFGYAGIVVAMLAALHPGGVIASAIFIASIFVGADAMSRATGVPSFIADVIMSLSLLTMLIAIFFTNYRIRR
jgi:simple sugar transport system permease protein